MSCHKIIVSLFFVLVVSSSVFAETFKQSGFEYHVNQPDSWVHPQRVDLSKVENSDAGTSWLLSDTQILMKNDNYARYHHYAVRVNLENGLKDASEFSIYFQPDFQSMDINSVKRYRSGKIKDLTTTVDVRLLQREESYSQGIFDGGVTAMLLLNDVQVGDVVEFSYTIKGRNPIFKNEYFSGFPVNWSTSIARMYAKIISDKALNYKVHNADEKNLKVSRTNDEFHYIWDTKDIAAIYDEGEYPGWFDPYGSVRFSQYESWSGVVDWALDLYQVSEPKDPALIALSDQWIKESKDKKEYVEKVIRYAQNNIRYFGIEIGQNSHKPYTPDQVFERKYGDCKDKAMFINTMLARQDIKAYPALVSSRTSKAIDTLLPQPGAFDHVISTFNLNGKDYWIDGTREFQFGTLDHIGVGDFQKALVVKKGNDKLTSINAEVLVNSFKLSEVYDSQNYQLPVRLKAIFEYRYGRAEGMRSFLKSEGFENFSKSFTNFYAKQYPTVLAKHSVIIDDDEKLNKMTVVADFEIPNYWENNKAEFEVALYGDIIADYIAKPSVVSRTSPYYYSYPVDLEHSITVNYNDKVDWNLEDRSVTLSSKVMEYNRSINEQENSIQVVHQFKSKRDHVEQTDMVDYLNLVDEIRKAIYYSVSISNSEYVNQDSEDLKTVLKKLLKKNRK